MSLLTEDKLYAILTKVNEEQFSKIQNNSVEQTALLREEIKSVNKDILVKVESLTKEVSQLKDDNLVLERKVRKNNIIIFGLEIKKG